MDPCFVGFPLLETSRLRLRNFKIDDAFIYHNYHSLQDGLAYYDWKPETPEESLEDVLEKIEENKSLQYLFWAIEEKESGTLIGECGLFSLLNKGEINYMLAPSHWGKGYMQEAIRAIMAFTFENTEIYRFQALSHPLNTGSNKMLESLGFTREGLLRKYAFNPLTGEYVDALMWSLLKEEHVPSPYRFLGYESK